MKMNTRAPRLVMCAATWSMIGYPSARREWSVPRKLRAIKDAGFDGVCAYLTPEIKGAADQLRLRLMSGFDCRNVGETLPQLQAQRDLGAHFINIQLLNHDTTPIEAARVAV